MWKCYGWPCYKVICPSLYQELKSKYCPRVIAQQVIGLLTQGGGLNDRKTACIPPVYQHISCLFWRRELSYFVILKKKKIEVHSTYNYLSCITLLSFAVLQFLSFFFLHYVLSPQFPQNKSHASFSFSLSPSPTWDSSFFYPFYETVLN